MRTDVVTIADLIKTLENNSSNVRFRELSNLYEFAFRRPVSGRSMGIVKFNSIQISSKFRMLFFAQDVFGSIHGNRDYVTEGYYKEDPSVSVDKLLPDIVFEIEKYNPIELSEYLVCACDIDSRSEINNLKILLNINITNFIDLEFGNWGIASKRSD